MSVSLQPASRAVEGNERGRGRAAADAEISSSRSSPCDN